MKQVGIREFRDHATTYLSGTESIAVSKHGHIVGIYVPLKRDEEKVKRAIDRFGQAIEQILEETGMNEEELIELLGLNK
jgi:antitoxin (DNA-binding transcriptional repressor) of toxin-antitoxin stability system